MDLLLTGERIDARRAFDIGLVTRLADRVDTLISEVTGLAQRIALRPPTATLFAKQAARAAGRLDLKSGLDLELDLFAMLAPMDDVKEAALAFREKRAPRFTGA